MDAILQFTVTNQEIERTDEFTVVEGSENYLQAHFTFTTPDWNGMIKTGVFINEDGTMYPSLCKDDTCDVPPAWLKEQKGAVGVIGSDGTAKITTYAAKVRIRANGYTGEDIEEETHTYFDQLLEAFANKYLETEAQAKLAQRWAVGLEDKPETLEDNAKYYAGQAHADALRAELERIAVVELSEHAAAVGGQVDEDKQAAGQYKENAAQSEEKAALSESNAKASETAAQAAQEAAESAEAQAGTYAAQTSADRNAVEQAKSDVDEAKQEVSEKKEYVEQAVGSFELLHQQAVADVNNAGQLQAERVEEEGEQAVININTAGVTQKKAVEDAGATQSAELQKYKGVKVSNAEPTEEAVEIWINPDDEEEYCVPEIRDDEENEVDTWSSKKIAGEIGELKGDLVELDSQLNESITEISKYITIVISKNIFDVSKAFIGNSRTDCYALTSNGKVYNNTAGMDAVYSVSDFIEVEEGNTIFFSSNNKQTAVYQLATYDYNKVFIPSIVTWKTTYTIPNGVKYIRFCGSTLTANFQCEYGKITTYETYYNKKYLNTLEVDKEQIVRKNRLVLPKKMYCIVGKENNIYYKNVIRGDFRSEGIYTKGGNALRRTLRYNPSATGQVTFEFNLIDDYGKTVESKNVICTVASTSAKSGSTLKVLVIGDSFINSTYVTKGLIDNFANDVASIKLLGTLGNGDNKHEGRSGWSTYDYIATTSFNNFTNPFLNGGVFDFGNYMRTNGIETPNFVIINLGINDTWRPMGGKTTHENLMTMINSIHVYDSSIKILVGTTPSPYLGEGENGYECQTHENMLRQNVSADVIDNLSDMESSKVYVVPTHCNFDTDYNFRMGTVAKNARNTDTLPFCEDTTHPLESGFFQIADSYFYALKAIE